MFCDFMSDFKMLDMPRDKHRQFEAHDTSSAAVLIDLINGLMDIWWCIYIISQFPVIIVYGRT